MSKMCPFWTNSIKLFCCNLWYRMYPSLNFNARFKISNELLPSQIYGCWLINCLKYCLKMLTKFTTLTKSFIELVPVWRRRMWRQRRRWRRRWYSRRRTGKLSELKDLQWSRFFDLVAIIDLIVNKLSHLFLQFYTNQNYCKMFPNKWIANIYWIFNPKSQEKPFSIKAGLRMCSLKRRKRWSDQKWCSCAVISQCICLTHPTLVELEWFEYGLNSNPTFNFI